VKERCRESATGLIKFVSGGISTRHPGDSLNTSHFSKERFCPRAGVAEAQNRQPYAPFDTSENRIANSINFHVSETCVCQLGAYNFAVTTTKFPFTVAESMGAQIEQ
jgi:hypothetical protein